MIHTFSVEAAKEFGLLPAILLNHINYWVMHNEANGKGYHDGTYWTYNSNKAFSELFPYASKNQINYALNKLKDAGAIMVGNYNKAAYDRTLWYAVTDYGKSFLEISENHFGNFRNGDEKFQKPIPDINTDNNKNNKPYKSGGKKIPPTLEEVKAYCEERNNPIRDYKDVDKVIEEYNRICKSLPKCMRATKKRRDKVATRLKDYTLDDFIKAFEMSEQSDFLSGRRTEWRASLDWFIQNEDNLAKVLEGRYVETKTGNAEAEGHSSGDSEFYEDLPDVW